MPRRKKPPATPSRARPWRVGIAGVVTIVIVGAAVLAVGWVGDVALRQIGGRDRYRTPFADIRCDTPPGLDRPTFLAEVRYVGDLPGAVNPLDADERDSLSAGFAKHPWVEAVDGVTAEPGGAVNVALRFRTPVLAVTTTGRETRLLDRSGVLLPIAPTPAGVAELTALVHPPRVAAGEVWRDAQLERAVELVGAYGAKRVDHTSAGWTLVLPDGKVLAVGR